MSAQTCPQNVAGRREGGDQQHTRMDCALTLTGASCEGFTASYFWHLRSEYDSHIIWLESYGAILLTQLLFLQWNSFTCGGAKGNICWPPPPNTHTHCKIPNLSHPLHCSFGSTTLKEHDFRVQRRPPQWGRGGSCLLVSWICSNGLAFKLLKPNFQNPKFIFAGMIYCILF